MKTKQIINILTCFFIMCLPPAVFAQGADLKDERLGSLIKSRKFTFVAESATPMQGGMIRLSSHYEFTVDGNTISSFLPYFGVAFRPSIGGSDSPLRFKSNDFSFEARPQRKNGYTIQMRLRDMNDPDRIRLSVSNGGYATLQVSSVDRQPISFYGYIREVRENKPLANDSK